MHNLVSYLKKALKASNLAQVFIYLFIYLIDSKPVGRKTFKAYQEDTRLQGEYFGAGAVGKMKKKKKKRPLPVLQVHFWSTSSNTVFPQYNRFLRV